MLSDLLPFGLVVSSVVQVAFGSPVRVCVSVVINAASALSWLGVFVSLEMCVIVVLGFPCASNVPVHVR